MLVTINCPCGNSMKITENKALRKKYCSRVCLYRYRTRPNGIRYEIKVFNSAWFSCGHKPWNLGLTGLPATSGSIKKGEHRGISTEFKYKNGKGYRHFFYNGIFNKKCEYSECKENNIKRLQVHHKDKNRENNDISNLQVLCRKHHLQIHGKKEHVVY